MGPLGCRTLNPKALRVEDVSPCSRMASMDHEGYILGVYLEDQADLLNNGFRV